MVARKLWILIVLVALFSACAAGGVSQSTAPAGEETEMPIPQRTGILPSKMTQPLELAMTDLTTRLGVGANDVELISLTTQEMPVGDLGCPSAAPAKGTAQPDGIVLGKEIILKTGGQTYVYHVYRLRVALCEGTLPDAQSGTPALPDASEEAIDSALTDLAARLKVGKDAIQITSVEKRMWGDTSLGCPQPGVMYAQVVTPGFLIQLTAGGKAYAYHASLLNAVLCEK